MPRLNLRGIVNWLPSFAVHYSSAARAVAKKTIIERSAHNIVAPNRQQAYYRVQQVAFSRQRNAEEKDKRPAGIDKNNAF